MSTKIRKSKKRDKAFVNELVKRAKSVKEYESNRNLLEQLVLNILSEYEKDLTASENTIDELYKEFVDWNEIRVSTQDRLGPFFEKHTHGDEKRKVTQALLNKIFSRSGCLEYQFLFEFESDNLEDYLTGIIEMSETTRKRLIFKVFKLKTLPFTSHHEVIFEKVETHFLFGDQNMKELFFALERSTLEGIKELFDQILIENEKSNSDDGFNSDTLNSIIKAIN